MARPKTPTRAGTATVGRNIDRILLLERLAGPILPGILASIALLVWVLNGAGVIPADTSILVAGAAGILLCLFGGVRPFLDERLSGPLPALLAAFALALGGGLLFTLSRAVLLAPPIASAELAIGGGPLAVTTSGSQGPYRIVVAGRLPTSDGQSPQSERYAISVHRGGAPAGTLRGEFSERWSTRRLGRRGTAPVHTVRNVEQHIVDDPGSAGFSLALEELVPAGGVVGVKVHPDPFPAPLAAGLGTALVLAALGLDAWRSVDPGEGVLTAFTLAALLGVAAFRRFAPAHPGLPDLLFNAALGGVTGWALAAAGWTVLRKPLGRWIRG